MSGENAAAPQFRDPLEIFGWQRRVRAGGVLAHLRRIAGAGNRNTHSWVGDAKGDGRLSQGLHRTVDEKSQLFGFSQLFSKGLAFEAPRPDVFACESLFVGRR